MQPRVLARETFQFQNECKSFACDLRKITYKVEFISLPLLLIHTKNKQDCSLEMFNVINDLILNNNITSLQEYQKLVEDWIIFYNTDRLKSKKSGK